MPHLCNLARNDDSDTGQLDQRALHAVIVVLDWPTPRRLDIWLGH